MFRFKLFTVFMVLFFILVITMFDFVLAGDHLELLSKHYRIEKPEGDGPFPAVILVSGCSGFGGKLRTNHYNHVQSQLVKSGFATLRVNYLAARYAQDCREVSTWDVADDIRIAADYLEAQDFIKKGAMNVIGWSWGGASAFKALKKTKNRPPVQVDTVVAYYPYCKEGKPPGDIEIPILVLAGEIDDMAPFKKCKSIFSQLPEKLMVKIYENARHCFDIAGLPEKTPSAFFGTLGYNEAAAESAWREVINFLKR